MLKNLSSIGAKELRKAIYNIWIESNNNKDNEIFGNLIDELYAIENEQNREINGASEDKDGVG